MVVLFIAVGVLFISLLFFVARKMPEWKGKFSERLVSKKILKLPAEYKVFNNLLFECNGYSTQIDHIVVSPYGVFVIETKGYKGWILGGEYAEYWTQSIYGHKYSLYNPIKQNEGHVRYLQHMLNEIPNIPYIPIVVFDNSADLKIHIENHIVINRRRLIRAILQYHTVILSTDIVNKIADTIRHKSVIVDKESMKRHKYHARNQQIRTDNQIRNGICPRCGGQLVLRRGKYGKFYGCSNFPRCRFTMKA